MVNLIEMSENAFNGATRPRYRDRRGFYASSALVCRRDLYWQITGIPITNPTDFWGSLKMLAGDGIEHVFFKRIFGQLASQGWILEGDQVSVGGSSPCWDGLLDGLLRKVGTEQRHVIEFKTKSGNGASYMAKYPSPSDDNLAQLGLYLRDLSEKGVTNEGSLYYVLLNDANFGQIIQIPCVYNEMTKKVHALRCIMMDGSTRPCKSECDTEMIYSRWRDVEAAIAAGAEPPGDYKYMYEITAQSLKQPSDSMLKKIGDGEAVWGDWRVAYSRYKNLQLERDHLPLSRTMEEIKMVKNEYYKRHPKSTWKPLLLSNNQKE